MDRKLIIHIGTEKTGTTSIQNFLYSNEALLAASGFGLLHCAGEPNNNMYFQYAGARRALSNVFARRADAERIEQDWRSVFAEQFEREVAALPDSIHTVIISSEHLQSHLLTEEPVQALADLFKRSFKEFAVVVYLRRQDRLVVSRYSTAVKAGTHRKFRFPLKSNAGFMVCSYFESLSIWARVFGENAVIPRIFDKNRLVNGDLLLDFSRVCGFEPVMSGNAERPRPLNTSLSAAALHAMHEVNLAFKEVGDIPEAVERPLRQALLTQIAETYKGPQWYPQRADAEAFYRQFSESNAALSQRWFSGQPVFDEGFDEYPVETDRKRVPRGIISTILQIMLRQAMEDHVPARSQRVLKALGELDASAPAPGLLRKLSRVVSPVNEGVAKRLLLAAKELPVPAAPPHPRHKRVKGAEADHHAAATDMEQ